MKNSPLAGISGDIERAARSTFHPGNYYIRAGDQMNRLLEGVHFDSLIDAPGISVELAALLSLITVFQFREQLTDQQAVEALRVRIDWKYALHLPLIHPGINVPLLCRFRCSIQTNPAGEEHFQRMLNRLAASGFLDDTGTQKAGQVLAAVCTLNRVEHAIEAMNAALQALAVNQAEWLRSVILPAWYTRYRHPTRLIHLLDGHEDPAQMALVFGADIHYLLKACEASEIAEVQALPEVQHLRQVLERQYELAPDPDRGWDIQLRQGRCAAGNGTGAYSGGCSTTCPRFGQE